MRLTSSPIHITQPHEPLFPRKTDPREKKNLHASFPLVPYIRLLRPLLAGVFQTEQKAGGEISNDHSSHPLTCVATPLPPIFVNGF